MNEQSDLILGLYLKNTTLGWNPTDLIFSIPSNLGGMKKVLGMILTSPIANLGQV